MGNRFFICGMSRGGTTWMGHCLNEHPDVAVFGESLFWGRYYLKPEKGECYSCQQVKEVYRLISEKCVAFLGEGQGDLKQFSRDNWRSMLLKLDDSPATPAVVFQRICDCVAEVEGKPHVAEKTPHHVNWISRISTAIPGARFMIMVRDPYSFMLSYKHQGDRKPPEAKKRFEDKYHPIACAYVWRNYMRSAFNAQSAHKDQILKIEFSDLKNSPTLVWKEVLSFLDLKEAPFIPVEDKNSSFPLAHRELLPVDIFWMNVLARKWIRKGGYELRCSNVSPIAILASLLHLFPWAIKTYLILRTRVPGGLLRYFARR